tara:strand:- start:10246 stop:11148 length:903 start_codon:yes stop_codon:yes gene_type:complete
MKKVTIIFLLLFIFSCSDKSDDLSIKEVSATEITLEPEEMKSQQKNKEYDSSNSYSKTEDIESQQNNKKEDLSYNYSETEKDENKKEDLSYNYSETEKDENKKEITGVEENNSNSSVLNIEFGPKSGNEITANYRVTEQLARLPSPIQAVGYTNSITGGIYIDSLGNPDSNSILNIDLSSLKSDESNRDNYLKRNSLETDKFPEAVFEIKDIIGLDTESLMNTGKNDFEMQLVGDLTIHGVTKTKTWNITASSESGKLKGKGSVSFPFSDFDMKIPQLFFIISVEDKITLELDFDINISL